jgi:hypothetical protein
MIIFQVWVKKVICLQRKNATILSFHFPWNTHTHSMNHISHYSHWINTGCCFVSMLKYQSSIWFLRYFESKRMEETKIQRKRQTIKGIYIIWNLKSLGYLWLRVKRIRIFYNESSLCIVCGWLTLRLENSTSFEEKNKKLLEIRITFMRE